VDVVMRLFEMINKDQRDLKISFFFSFCCKYDFKLGKLILTPPEMTNLSKTPYCLKPCQKLVRYEFGLYLCPCIC